jgi:arabinogalactan endo-1,4-beta-galactosidase
MKFIKGMDISVQNEIERLGARYFTDGKEGDALGILKAFDTNAVRLRLWNDPYDEQRRPYGGGTNDLQTTIALAKRAKRKEMLFLLDLHYSDFWADPEKQVKPKVWQDLTGEALEGAVYDYTFKTVSTLMRHGVMPDMVQLGNEITNGLLWPDGRFVQGGTPPMIGLLSAGIKAVHDFAPGIKTVLHLDWGGDNRRYRKWFDEVACAGLSFDIIGLSYYPFWHGTLAELENNMNDISARYNKDVLVVETAFPFTTEATGSKTMVFTAENTHTVSYSADRQGQRGYMLDLMDAIKRVKNDRGLGFFYWEPTWINIRQASWATEAGRKYLNNPHNAENIWANLALFDYNGNALPTLHTIRDFCGNDQKLMEDQSP